MGMSSQASATGLSGDEGPARNPLLVPVANPINIFAGNFPSSLVKPKQVIAQASTPFPEMPDYIFQRIIGSGAEASVYEVVLRSQTDVRRAVKHCHATRFLDGGLPREVAIAASLDHPSLLKCIDAKAVGDGYVILMELAELGALSVSPGRPELTTAQAVFLLRDIAGGLAHMHARNIVHRDVKPGNILAFPGRFVLTDFSVSVQLEAGGSVVGVVGTNVFMAPEIGVAAYDPRPADVWALGVTCYALLYGAFPWTLGRVFEKVADGQNPARGEVEGDLAFPASPRIPAELKRLLTAMLEKDPERRLTALAVYEDPWLAEVGTAWGEILRTGDFRRPVK